MIKIDAKRHEVRVNGRVTKEDLSPKEWELLRALREAKGEIRSREQLIDSVWQKGDLSAVDTRTVDQHVSRLRRKIEPAGKLLVAVTGYGYRWVGN